MQPNQSLTDPCHYPDCTNLSTVICKRCHQSFCLKHVHRQWGKYMCEFCFLLEQAQGAGQKGSRRIVYILCVLLFVSGILLLFLGLNNPLAVILILGGIGGAGGVATSRRMILPPKRASDIDADTDMRRLFGDRDDQ